MTDSSFIAFHRPSIEQEEFDAVRDVLASGWLTTGKVALDFEQRFAAHLGCKHALAVSSATAGLQLALDAVGISEGDEVLVPTYTFTATAEVVTYFKARPVLCDSVRGGFNIDPDDIEKRITSRTKAIIPVHLAGEPCHMDRLQAIAEHHGLRVIEDAAHALPAHWNSRKIGTISDCTAFSFYATKTITTGEGGMLTTNDDKIAARAAKMRLHGISSDAWKRYSREGSWYYEVESAGYKMNMPDLLAALGRAQLAKAERFLQRRAEIAARYDAAFSEMTELAIPPRPGPSSQHSWHLYILRLERERVTCGRNQFIELLKEAGVATAVHYIPLHLHPYYREAYGYRQGDFVNAEDAYERCISLPIYPDLSDDEVNRVIETVKTVVAQNRGKAAAA